MNRPTQLPIPGQRGAALLTTLVVISLVTIIVISFFAMIGVARKSSSYHKDSASLQNLKDSAISLALAQIREGTTREAEMWTSQPGVIRTFGESTGTPSRIYKLYSDDEMTVDAGAMRLPAELSLTTDVPSSWKDVPGVFVDLNEPVASMSDNDLHFPIVDPRLFDGKSGSESATPEGFSYIQSHANGGGNVTGILGPNDASHPNDQRIPMPVKWIYQLRDGSLGTVDDSGKFTPFANESDASESNPMVGRFGFWSDDESCKLNLNTASEAIPWDTPRCATPEDVEFARHPPVRNEVQRFGGHPATTCLSSVFFPHQFLDPSDPADQAKFRAIYDLVPKVNNGGYLDGKSPKPVAFDTDRLYANVEEALLLPGRTENALFQHFDPGKLSRSRFLLTANSRAPEVTAWGGPRVCLWPVYRQNLDTHRTAFDRLIAFNSTLNGRPYAFLRNSAQTNRSEYSHSGRKNEFLLLYLRWQSWGKLQGYPLSFRDKYYGNYKTTSTGVYTQNFHTGIIGFTDYMRQTNLHDTTEVEPGKRVVPYAQPLKSYYGSLIHGQVPNLGRSALPWWLRMETGDSRHPWIYANQTGISTNGIGRIYVPSEVGLAFSLAAEHKSDGSKFNADLVNSLAIPPGYKAIQAGVLVEGFCAAQGYTMIAPDSAVGIFGLENLRLKTSAGTVAPTASTSWGMWMYSTPHLHLAAADQSGYPNTDWWVGWGGSGGRYLYGGNGDSYKGNPIEEQYSRGYFLVPSSDTKVTVTTTTPSTVEGRRLHIRMSDQRWWPGWNGTSNSENARRTHFLIPENMEIPLPEQPAERKPTWAERYTEARSNQYSKPDLLDSNDVVRTWVSRHGDHRLQLIREYESGDVAKLNPKQYLFVPHPAWDPENGGAPTAKQIHSFTLPGGTPEDGATFQRGIVRGANYSKDHIPDFTIDPDTDPTFRENIPSSYPYSVDPSETRDFDNGTGSAPDGAYWNKADDVAQRWSGNVPPYFAKDVWDGYSASTLREISAPNQQVPSAVVLGSINSAAATGVPWTTYLFRPDITPGGHLGAKNRTMKGNRDGAPPDHTLLDWFWMPVVQPYALSERFSTAGKINLNYRIAPFSYIKRATGLHAVLKSERMLAIPTSAGGTYKDYNARNSNKGWRHRIDAEETLLQFENKFNRGEVFRLASEICEQFLVPEEETLGGMQAFWDRHRLTGDNTLERPYANIYPRLTARSNVFRVHFIAQTIRKARTSDPNRFEPELDSTVGEYRGEALVERAIDPNDTSIPDYRNHRATRLDNFYTYRILYTRRFAP